MEAFLARSRGYGAAIAVGKSGTHGELSYDQLWSMADSIRGVLRENLATGKSVAILAQRSAWAYASVLAALSEGCFFVPINPGWPQARRDKVLTLVGAQLLLYEERYSELLAGLAKPIAVNVEKLNAVSEIKNQVIQSSGLAYVMFTSGSTGEPKGISISQENLAAFLQAMKQVIPFVAGERFTQIYDLSFDLGVGEILLALLSGGSLHPLEPAGMTLLDKYLSQAAPTVWSSTPSMIESLNINKNLTSTSAESIRYSLIGGERLTVGTASLWSAKAPKSKIFNLYGPTEATVYLTCHEWQKGEMDSLGAVPIGTPLPGNQIQLVDEALRPVGSGEKGELIIAGPQVAAGYWQDDIGSRRAFVKASGRRWYRTGDVARVNSKGVFEFLGRRDDQIKINGFRLELGEIEAVARAVFTDSAVAALALSEEGGGQRLVLVVQGVHHEASENLLREHMQKQLPAYAVPAKILFSQDWPLTANGKLDRQALSEIIQRIG